MGTQYFTSSANELALLLFHENPYGEYWDDLYQILKGTVGPERDTLTAEYMKECMPKLAQEDHETATKVSESLGGHERKRFQLLWPIWSLSRLKVMLLTFGPLY